MSLTFVTVASGFTVSSAVTLFPADRALAVQVPASVTGQVRLQFASQVDATSNAFFRLQKEDGSVGDYVVTSGPGFGVVPHLPTAHVRVMLNAIHAFNVTSIGLYPIT